MVGLNLLIYFNTLIAYVYFTGVKVESNSFLSPRWGGIFIYNVPNPGVNDTLPVPVSLDMKSVMEVFITQLKLLLNIQSVVSMKHMI